MMSQEKEELTPSGFVPGPPNWGIGFIDGAGIDRQICAESACNGCGHVGLRYEPFCDYQERRYIAFAACPACGLREEF